MVAKFQVCLSFSPRNVVDMIHGYSAQGIFSFKKEKTRTLGAPCADRCGMGGMEDISSAHELMVFVNISHLFPMCALTEHFMLCQVENLLTPKDGRNTRHLLGAVPPFAPFDQIR